MIEDVWLACMQDNHSRLELAICYGQLSYTSLKIALAIISHIMFPNIQLDHKNCCIMVAHAASQVTASHCVTGRLATPRALVFHWQKHTCDININVIPYVFLLSSEYSQFNIGNLSVIHSSNNATRSALLAEHFSRYTGIHLFSFSDLNYTGHTPSSYFLIIILSRWRTPRLFPRVCLLLQHSAEEQSVSLTSMTSTRPTGLLAILSTLPVVLFTVGRHGISSKQLLKRRSFLTYQHPVVFLSLPLPTSYSAVHRCRAPLSLVVPLSVSPPTLSF